jgi:SAM-dependent methyltransferase
MSIEFSKRRVGAGIAIVSASMMMTEIVLTRISSVVIGYHFAFFVISAAMLGIGAAALAVYHFQQHLPENRTYEFLLFGSAALAVLILASDLTVILIPVTKTSHATVSPKTAETIDFIIIFLTALAPFFAGGFVVSLAVTRFSHAVHTIYFFSLIGAAAGCAIVIPVLEAAGAPTAMVLVAALASGADLAFLKGALRTGRFARLWIPWAVMSAIVLLAGADSFFDFLRIRMAKNVDLDSLAIEFNKWNSFSMVTVINAIEPSKKHFSGWGLSRNFTGYFPAQKSVRIDMGATTQITRFDGDFDKVHHALHDITAFAYYLKAGQGGKVCVIGAGGGRDVLSALAAMSKHVTAVDINPIIINDVVRGAFRKFTGGLYDRRDVTPVVADGRAFIRSSDKSFNVIQLSMVETQAAARPGAYSLTENSLYTVEAIRDYLDHLKPGGLLTISVASSSTSAAGLRLAATIWQALRDSGRNPAESTAVVGTKFLGGKRAVINNFVVMNGAFPQSELANIRDSNNRLGFMLTYLPGFSSKPGNSIAKMLTSSTAEDFDRQIAEFELDVSPATDDRPFFFYQSYFKDSLAVIGLGGPGKPSEKKGSGLSILLKTALVVCAMTIFVFAVPMFFSRGHAAKDKGRALGDVSYAACLGFGFMVVEIFMLQKTTFYLGSPTWALSTTLLALLGASGLGSLAFEGVRKEARPSRLFLALALLVCILAAVWQSGLADEVFYRTCALPVLGRTFVAAALIAPAGLLMGMPLPACILAVASRTGQRIPWLWAANSAASVFGVTLAAIVSIHAGFVAMLWVGVAFYVAALILAGKVMA